jgi:ADP-ribosylglycohydrolase
MSFESKLAGALYGVAIGDGMGAPVEGRTPEYIAERFQDTRRFLPPTHGDDPATGKGHGRITDDTLMTEALMRAYAARRGHLDAYDVVDYLVPEFTQTEVWVSERQQEMPLLGRLNRVEHVMYYRVDSFRRDPRTAGVGNVINCAAAMYIMPVGAVNAGDSRGAYDEAMRIAQVETDSYGVEGAAVLAAAYAAGFARNSTVSNVLQAAQYSARDGTAAAIEAVLRVTSPNDTPADWIRKTRRAFLPFCPAAQGQRLRDLDQPVELIDTDVPSRTLSIEEVPVALAALAYGAGDFEKTLQAGVFYGRDCDSIAGMAAGLFGAIFGLDAVPEDLRQASDKANRRDWGAQADAFAEVVREIAEQDDARWNARREALD